MLEYDNKGDDFDDDGSFIQPSINRYLLVRLVGINYVFNVFSAYNA